LLLERKFLSGVLTNKAPLRKIQRRNKEYSIKNIVILGDSVAYGYGTKEGIAKYLRESFPDSRITNLCINGLTSDGLVSKLTSVQWDRHLASPDLTLINIGGNYLLQDLRKLGPARFVRNFKAVRINYRKN